MSFAKLLRGTVHTNGGADIIGWGGEAATRMGSR